MANYDMLVICGPTASGKSSVAVKLAKLIDAEIISADSMQIYKEMDIGTAKPDSTEQDGIYHYNIGNVSVSEQYNVARFVSDSKEYIEQIKSKGKKIIIVGGTGLYIDSLINNVSFIETEKDDDYRNKLNALAKENGNEFVYSMLKNIDEKAAADIHPNNVKRVIRALEIINSTGLTLEEVNKQSIRDKLYKPLFIGINYKNRDILYDRINRRVDLMLDKGLLHEADILYNTELSSTASGAIGYKELFEYFKGNLSLDDAIELLKKNSRNYAKRQITWFKRNNEINWFYPDLYEDEFDFYNALSSFVLEKFEV